MQLICNNNLQEVARALLGKASKEPHTITIKGKVCEIKPAVPKSDSFSRRTSCVAGHVTSALGRTSSSFTFQQGAKLRDPWTQENFMLDLPLQNPSEQWDATSNTYAVGISYESHDSNLSGNPAKMYHEPHELPSPIFGVNGIMYYPSCFPFEPLVDDSFSRWSVAPGDEFRCIDGPNPVNAKRSSMHPAWSSELASPVFVGGMPYSYPTMSDFPDPISLPCFHSWPDNVPTSANMVAFQGNAQEEEEE